MCLAMCKIFADLSDGQLGTQSIDVIRMAPMLTDTCIVTFHCLWQWPGVWILDCLPYQPDLSMQTKPELERSHPYQCFQLFQLTWSIPNWNGPKMACESACWQLLQTDGLFSRLAQLKEKIEATEALIQLDLDQRRNELTAFDLVLTIVTLSVAFVSMVASIFGQNLYWSTTTSPLVRSLSPAQNVQVPIVFTEYRPEHLSP